MGCISSKIMTKSASFREELNRSARRRSNNVEEIVITKNSGDQIVALLCAANAVARKLKEQPNESKGSLAIKPANSNSRATNEPEDNDIETINTWELLEGLEDNTEEWHEIDTPNASAAAPSRSFHTVEEFDAMAAANQSLQCSERLVIVDKDMEQGSRRKAMAKELTALKVPGFEFVRTGSLREWLQQGGQVFSPGSYVTPKFGDLVSPGASNGDSTVLFDPELVEQFEQAMEQLTIEEESILKEITESLEEGDNEECTSITESSDNVQGQVIEQTA